MSATSLLIINDSGDLEINKPEARNVEAFNKLIRRDRGSVGDSDGKLKKRANAELLYIYLVYDPRSMFYNLPQKSREVKAIEYAGLPKDWKVDSVVDLAISTYINEYAKLSPIGNAYYAAERALFNTAEEIHDIQESIGYYKGLAKKVNRVLMDESKDGVKIGNTELITNLKEATAILNAITKLQSDSIKIIKDLPVIEQTVKELLGKYAEEGGSVKNVVGGGTLGNREE